MTTPPPIQNQTPPPFPIKQELGTFKKILNYASKHKLAISISLAILGWFLFFVVSCSQATNLHNISLQSTAIKADLSTLQVKATNADEILKYTPVIKIVTQTQTSTPLYTPTNTLTPTTTPTPSKTPLPSPTVDALKLPFNDGNYLVGVDKAPGVWLSNGDMDNCYWEITTMTGDIINNYFGRAGGTMYVYSSAFAIHVEDCGEWTFYANP
jgi:hypothetical protein